MQREHRLQSGTGVCQESKTEVILILPDDVKKDAISAKVEHGVLTVELPKVVEEKVKVSRQIDIA